MPIDKKGQVTDDENDNAGDPNLVGKGATKPVSDATCAKMSPSNEYGCVDTYEGTLYGQ